MDYKKHLAERASIEECIEKALPTLIDGYLRRGKPRSDYEESRRPLLKRIQDMKYGSPPRICNI